MAGFAEEMAKRMVNKTITALEQTKNKVIETVKTRIHGIQNNININEQTLAQYYKDLETANRELLGYVTTPFAVDANLSDFLLKNKSIKIMQLLNSNTGVRVQFTTPIMNWNKKDVEMYFKNPNQETYLNHPEWFAEAMKMIFLDEKYRLLTTTVVDMPLMVNTMQFSTKTSPTGTYGNPHFTEYNCYRSSRNEYNKAIANNDYVRGFSIILAATATLVFTDSSVIHRMVNHFRESDEHYYQMLQDTESGMICSFKELKDHIQNKPKEVKKSTKAAKEPETATTETENAPMPIF
jgi:gas vesicle protein